MASLSEIIQLCRLCLVKDHVNNPIFDDPENTSQISLKISSCLPVKVSRDDDLPKKICDGCSIKLDLCYEFWNSTAQAEKTLLSMVEDLKNKVPETVVPQPIKLKIEPNVNEPPVPKPILVKKEVETGEPLSKRPRLSSAARASEEEDSVEDEDDVEDPDQRDIDEVKPGPSGLNQTEDSELNAKEEESDLEGFDVVDATNAEPKQEMTVSWFGNQSQSVVYCPKCGQFCQTYNDYDNHILQNPSHLSFDCFQCKEHVESWLDLKSHEIKAHNTTKKFLPTIQGGGYFCYFCGSKEMTMKNLDIHLQKNHLKWTLKCTMCMRVYKNPQSLHNHFGTFHAVINNVDLVCNQCYLHFYDPQIYSLHMTNCHKVQLKSMKYQCILCTSKLKENDDFLRHVHKHGKYTVSCDEMKDGRPAFVVWSRQCFVCSKVVESRAELVDHLLKVHFSGPTCPLCKVKVKGVMELHLRQVHLLGLDMKLKCKNEARYIPFVINKPVTDKICKVCYGLVPNKTFSQHMAMHKKQGTHQLKSQNPVVTTVPNLNQLSFCTTCGLRVVTTFMTFHKNIHKNHQKKPGKRLQSPARPKKKSQPKAKERTEMKCTECDRSYDTVENLVNHVKAQHFLPPNFNPYGMVPMEYRGLNAPEPFSFQNPIPDVNTLYLENVSQPQTGSARSRRGSRNRPKF